jgi:thiamine biosynthesis protein ThiI
MGVEYEVLVVHYSEIFLKCDYVRERFRQILISNIVNKLKNIDEGFDKIKVEDNLICIYGNFSERVINSIANTFGVSYVSPAFRCKSSLASIKECFNKINILGLDNFPKTFRIRAKKDKQLKISRKTIEIELASFFRGIKVDLKNAELTIYVHSTLSQTFIYWEKVAGPGGLPYGSQGKVIALISNGIDSPVAAWLMGKRGCEIIILHFGETDIRKIVIVLENYAGREIKLINVPQFTDFLRNIKESNSGKYQCIICKSGMYRIANLLAEKYGAKAIVSGENLGQVASQTLENLSIIDESSDLPILRPLIGFNKEEIVNIAKRIGTFDFQINKRCEFVPKKPATQISPEIYKLISGKTEFETEINKLWRGLEVKV